MTWQPPACGGTEQRGIRVEASAASSSAWVRVPGDAIGGQAGAALELDDQVTQRFIEHIGRVDFRRLPRPLAQPLPQHAHRIALRCPASRLRVSSCGGRHRIWKSPFQRCFQFRQRHIVIGAADQQLRAVVPCSFTSDGLVHGAGFVFQRAACAGRL